MDLKLALAAGGATREAAEKLAMAFAAVQAAKDADHSAWQERFAADEAASVADVGWDATNAAGWVLFPYEGDFLVQRAIKGAKADWAKMAPATREIAARVARAIAACADADEAQSRAWKAEAAAKLALARAIAQEHPIPAGIGTLTLRRETYSRAHRGLVDGKWYERDGEVWRYRTSDKGPLGAYGIGVLPGVVTNIVPDGGPLVVEDGVVVGAIVDLEARY